MTRALNGAMTIPGFDQPTSEDSTTLDLPLFRSLGSALNNIHSLEDLSHAVTIMPLLLQEVLDTAHRGDADVSSSKTRARLAQVVASIRTSVSQAAPRVLGDFNGHAEFGRIHSVISEVRTCSDGLCSLAYDLAIMQASRGAMRRYAKVATLLRGAADEMALLVGLRPVQPTKQRTPSNAVRDDHTAERTRAKRELAGLVSEMLARIDDSPDGRFIGQFYGLGVRAAALAAALGFEFPPVEHVIVRRPDFHPLLDAHPDWELVCMLQIHDLSGFELVSVDLHAFLPSGVDGPSSQPIVLPWHGPQVRERALMSLRGWQRAVERIDLGTLELSAKSATTGPSSFERWIFHAELRRWLRGDAAETSGFTKGAKADGGWATSPDVVRAFERWTWEETSNQPLAAINEALLAGRPAQEDRGAAEPHTKPRMKKEVAEPLIADHLMRKPHDTVKDVATAVGCSTGLVSQSKAWKLNLARLKLAKKAGTDPKAVKLDERTVGKVGGSKIQQLHDHRQQVSAVDAEIDARYGELSRQIGEYQGAHPGATPQEIAAAVGCTARDVEQRQAALDRLVAEQADEQLEDNPIEDPDTKRGTRQKWVDKQV